MENPKTAVIILNWNGLHLLKEFLPPTVKNSDPALGRIIVADNGSSDGSVGWVRRNFGNKVELMVFDRNYGFAEGYNRAIARATGYEYVVLLNSDAFPESGWLAPLTLFMDSHPDCAALQPKILSYRAPGQFEYAGAAGGFVDRHGYPYCRGRIFGHCEDDHGQYDTPMAVFWASGAALMVRRQLYLEAGGLDPAFFAHMEEIDLCWRLQTMGYSVWCEPAASVRHLGGGSLPAENPRKTYLNFRNNLLMLHKNLPDRVRGRILLERRLLDTLAWAKYAATFDFRNAAAIWWAHRDFRKMRTEYGVHPYDNILSHSPQQRISILAQHYLHGRKTYDRLKFDS